MKVELYVLEPGGQVRLSKSYDDYIRPAILWATEDAKSLAEALDVMRIAAQGSYIRGLFGGEKRNGSEHYAGLTVSNLRHVESGFYIRLFNTDKEYLVPVELMKKHNVDIYKVYYFGTINPFKCSTLNMILPSTSEDKLKRFIHEMIQLNKGVITEADERKLRKLSEELKVQIKTLSGSAHYVIYRSRRIFTACVPENLNKTVSESNTTHMECRKAEQAHYYAAVLNYMAYKVISKGREFVRGQYTKPLLAIVAAGLTWKDLPSQLREEIAGLSHMLSKKLTWVDYPTQKKALLEVAEKPEFARIIALLDEHIESTGKQERLEEALRFVSGSRESKG